MHTVAHNTMAVGVRNEQQMGKTSCEALERIMSRIFPLSIGLDL